MENLRLIDVLSLTCLLFWSPSHAELIAKSAAVNSSVSLCCRNTSLDTLSQLMWTKNTTKLLTFGPPDRIHRYPEAQGLRMNISESEDCPYALLFDKVQKGHMGTYKCETSTETGVWENTWRLIVTEDSHETGPSDNDKHKPSMLLLIAICAPCVGVILVCSLAILFRHRRGRRRRTAAAETVNTVYDIRSFQKAPEIYENCLGSQHSQNHHIYSN